MAFELLSVLQREISRTGDYPKSKSENMSKTADLRGMSDEQLDSTLAETQRELFQLRFQSATERLDTPRNMRRLRREIARILTLQRERQIVAAK